MQNIQFYVVLAILAFSFLSWAAGKIQEQREIQKVNKERRRQRDQLLRTGRTDGGDTPHPTRQPTGQQLAKERRERLRKLRAEQAERTREQIRVLTGQPPTAPSRTGRRQTGPGAAFPRPPARGGQRGPSAGESAITEAARAREQQEEALLKARARRAEIEARMRPETRPSRLASASGLDLSPDRLREAIVLSEILAPPVTLRHEGTGHA